MRRLDRVAVVVFHLSDFGDVALLEKTLDSERMTGKGQKISLAHVGLWVERSRSPFGATKPEAVGKLASESVPELLLLVHRQPDQFIVVLLHSLVLLLDVWPVAIVAAGAIVVALLALLGTAALQEWLDLCIVEVSHNGTDLEFAHDGDNWILGDVLRAKRLGIYRTGKVKRKTSKFQKFWDPGQALLLR